MKIVKVVLLTGLGVAALAFGAAFLAMAFVFSIGTATRELVVETTVRERATDKEVPGCLLAFEKEGSSYATSAGRTSERSGPDGTLRFATRYQYTGSPLMPWERERKPGVMFYLGPPPVAGGPDVEAWRLTLRFEEPWRDGTVPVTVEPQELLVRDASYVGEYGPRVGFETRNVTRDRPLRIARAQLVDGDVQTMKLDVLLDERQVAACRRTE